jgi:hypothetical protein
MPTDIVGSHFAPDAFAGQNGDNSPSSLLPGQQVRRGKDAKGIMKGTEISVPGSDWQKRTISAAPITANPGTKGPSKGAKVPAATSRRDKTGIVRPTR